jgi:hypothetical protein
MNKETLRKLSETSFDNKQMFSFPHELIDDPSLSVSQKRAILAEWASDACAIESFPTLRLLPGTTFPVTLSSIMDALVRLDDESEPKKYVAPAFRLSGGRHSTGKARGREESCVSYQFSRGRNWQHASRQVG